VHACCIFVIRGKRRVEEQNDLDCIVIVQQCQWVSEDFD